MPVSPLEQRVVDSIRSRADRMVADLRALVAMPTGCGHGAGLEAARTFMSARLSALGARVDRRAGGGRPDWLREGTSGGDAGDVLVADRSQSGAGARLLIAGHIDTVHDPAGSFKELSAAVGGASTGPGAADMKGGLIVALTALEALHDAGIAVRWTFVLNADEETGSFASAPILADLAPSADVGLVVEPAFGSGDFITVRPGSAQFLIEAGGREAHAGRDAAKGISAVAALCKAVTRVLERSDPAAGVTLNIGPLEGGRATNIVPGGARAWGNARYRSDEQRKAIDALLASIETGDTEHLPTVRTRVIHNRPPKPATALSRAGFLQCAGVSRLL